MTVANSKHSFRSIEYLPAVMQSWWRWSNSYKCSVGGSHSYRNRLGHSQAGKPSIYIATAADTSLMQLLPMQHAMQGRSQMVRMKSLTRITSTTAIQFRLPIYFTTPTD